MSKPDAWAILHCIAEERIREAYDAGSFDRLQGYGKPLELEDDSMIPEESRMAYKVLKNAGMCPPELEDEKEALRIAEMLANCPDEQERHKQMTKLECITARINARRRSPLDLEKDPDYYRKIVERVRLESKQLPSEK